MQVKLYKMRGLTVDGIGTSKALFRQVEEYGWTGGLSMARAVGPGSGIGRAIHRPEAPGSGAFWPLTRVPAKRGLSAKGLNRVGGGRGRGSGRLELVE
jgi:hypothetical protein